MRSARSIALLALQRVEHGAFANLALPELLQDSDLEPRDRAFATDLVYGTVRRRGALPSLPARRTYPPVERGPAHAPVTATADAVAPLAPRARGYVNGVLRAVARAGPPWPWPAGGGTTALGVRFSPPHWIVRV